MKERIAKVKEYYNYRNVDLAKMLNVANSGIGHILEGRNLPSTSFIQKFLEVFSDISANWLLLGEGDMFKDPQKHQSQPDMSYSTASLTSDTEREESEYSGFTPPIEREQTVQGAEEGLFHTSPQHIVAASADFSHATEPQDVSIKSEADTAAQTGFTEDAEGTANCASEEIYYGYGQRKSENSSCENRVRVTKILVFFSDGTFQEMLP